jgi:hypothetical protein
MSSPFSRGIFTGSWRLPRFFRRHRRTACGALPPPRSACRTLQGMPSKFRQHLWPPRLARRASLGPGSRLEIEVLHRVHTTIDHVITSCVPARRLAWIDHAIGVAMAQWLTFGPHKFGGTRVRTWGDLVHSGVDCREDGRAAGHQFHGDLVREFSPRLRSSRVQRSRHRIPGPTVQRHPLTSSPKPTSRTAPSL